MEIIRDKYNGNASLSQIRLDATARVAQTNKVIRNTILDTITRQLEPEIKTVQDFERFTEWWLNRNDQHLREIILAHCSDTIDKKQVADFFDFVSTELITGAEDLPTRDERSYKEGGGKLVMHLVKERNKSLIQDAKDHWLAQHKQIICAVCGFDFFRSYGERGQYFIEAHHNLPIAFITEETEMRIEDLTPLCSNCHRMIHRRRPWLTVQQLKDVFALHAL